MRSVGKLPDLKGRTLIAHYVNPPKVWRILALGGPIADDSGEPLAWVEYEDAYDAKKLLQAGNPLTEQLISRMAETDTTPNADE